QKSDAHGRFPARSAEAGSSSTRMNQGQHPTSRPTSHGYAGLSPTPAPSHSSALTRPTAVLPIWEDVVSTLAHGKRQNLGGRCIFGHLTVTRFLCLCGVAIGGHLLCLRPWWRLGRHSKKLGAQAVSTEAGDRMQGAQQCHHGSFLWQG